MFGSNRQGVHGAGAAQFAAAYRGALAGQGEGLQGQSYALPTKARPFDTYADFALLQDSVARFLAFANQRPWLNFMVTRVGCGLAGFQDEQVAPLFAQVPANCHVPGIWRRCFSSRIVAGSRGISHSETIAYLNDYVGSGEIVSGMAQGVDAAGAYWAKDKGYALVEAPALWNRYGRAAGYIRNQWMAWYATDLLAIWDGESRGTQNMIHTARKNRLDVQVVLAEPNESV